MEEATRSASQQNMIKQITNLASQIASRIAETEKRVTSKLSSLDKHFHKRIERMSQEKNYDKQHIQETSDAVISDLGEIKKVVKQMDTKLDRQLKLPMKDPYNKIEELFNKFEKHKNQVSSTMGELKEHTSVTKIRENLNAQQQQFESSMMKSYHALQENIKDNHEKWQKEMLKQQEAQFKDFIDQMFRQQEILNNKILEKNIEIQSKLTQMDDNANTARRSIIQEVKPEIMSNNNNPPLTMNQVNLGVIPEHLSPFEGNQKVDPSLRADTRFQQTTVDPRGRTVSYVKPEPLLRDFQSPTNQESTFPVREKSFVREGTAQTNMTESSREDSVTKALTKLWPTGRDWKEFSGEGEYNHNDYIDWCDNLIVTLKMDPLVVVSHLATAFTGIAEEWYNNKRKTKGSMT